MGIFDNKIEGNKPSGGTFEGQSYELIPKGTQCLAYVEDSQVESQDTESGIDQFIELKWRILKPESVANRVIYQKIRIWDSDGKKQNRAWMMLAAIDQNAGGIIGAQSSEPDDALLARALINKPMLIKLDVWDIGGKTGNWVCAVAPKPEGSVLTIPEKQIADTSIPF